MGRNGVLSLQQESGGCRSSPYGPEPAGQEGLSPPWKLICLFSMPVKCGSILCLCESSWQPQAMVDLLGLWFLVAGVISIFAVLRTVG